MQHSGMSMFVTRQVSSTGGKVTAPMILITSLDSRYFRSRRIVIEFGARLVSYVSVKG